MRFYKSITFQIWLHQIKGCWQCQCHPTNLFLKKCRKKKLFHTITPNIYHHFLQMEPRGATWLNHMATRSSHQILTEEAPLLVSVLETLRILFLQQPFVLCVSCIARRMFNKHARSSFFRFIYYIYI